MAKKRRALQRARPIAGGDISDSDLATLEQLFKALADENRILMLHQLAREVYMPGVEFSRYVGTTQSQTSYHLKQLADAGLIEGERNGRYIYYHIVDGAFERLAQLFELAD